MLFKKIIAEVLCLLLLVMFFSRIAFADSIKVKIDTIGGDRRQLSVWQIGVSLKNGKRIFIEQFDEDSKSDFFKINGKEIKDHRVVEAIIELINQFMLIRRKLDLLLFYPDECSDEDAKLFDDSDDIGTLSDKKDFLFKELIKLLKQGVT